MLLNAVSRGMDRCCGRRDTTASETMSRVCRHKFLCNLSAKERIPQPRPPSEMGSPTATISRLVSVMRARGIRRLLLTRVLPIVLIVPLLLQILLANIIGRDPRLFPPALRHAENLLIVTAHPDDECLFFSPSVLGVLSGNPDATGSLLVLSTG
jgi:hypothetical protein